MRPIRIVRSCFSRYFNSWWIPFVVSILSLASFVVFVLFEVAEKMGTNAPLGALMLKIPLTLGFIAISVVGLASATVWSLVQRRWVKFFSDLVLTALSLFGLYNCLGVLVAALMCCQD